MSVRVTHQSIQQSTLARLQGNLSSIASLQAQISSGRRISKPSDDPSGTVGSLQLRQQLRQMDAYDRSAADGTAWLNTTDTALQTASSQIRTARTLVLQGLNGSNSDQSRAALAVEVDGIGATLQALAKTQYDGRNVFAGTSTGAALVTGDASATPGGQSFAFATSGAVTRSVDSSADVRVDTDGASVFGSGSGASSVFSTLAEVSAKLKDPGAATASGHSLSQLLDDLDTHLNRVLTGLADVGARTDRIEAAQSAVADQKVNLTSQLSDVEDTDMPSAIINLQLQQTAYQASLTASSKVLQTSLMDFLR